jgi:hypothetical protein
MQPKPISETSGPPLPSLRVFTVISWSNDEPRRRIALRGDSSRVGRNRIWLTAKATVPGEITVVRMRSPAGPNADGWLPEA